MDLNDIKIPVNAKEFATYKMSKFTGSLWIESSTEGRPTREAGIIHANSQSYNILYDALLLCSKELSNQPYLLPTPRICSHISVASKRLTPFHYNACKSCKLAYHEVGAFSSRTVPLIIAGRSPL